MATLFQSFSHNADVKLPSSLEEATVRLIDTIPDIEQMVFTAKINCSNPDDGLTSDESASIMLYTMEPSSKENSFSYFLDRTMRTNDKQQLQPWLPYLKLLFHALSKLETKHRTIYRGVMGDVSANYPVGRKTGSSEFTICATSVKTLEEEQNFPNTGTRTLFAIEGESSRDISRHSYRETKDEILLMPDQQFEVVSCLHPDNDLHIIQMKEIIS